jgi:hypothetical protein
VDGDWDCLQGWCFGHGLGYSKYELGPIALSASTVSLRALREAHRGSTANGTAAGAGPVATVATVQVTDARKFSPSGAAVVQIFFSPLSITRTGVVRTKAMLAGFAKVAVPADAAGAAAAVTVRVDDLGFTVWDPMDNSHPWVVEPGQYLIQACRSECDCPVNATLTITA